MKVVAFVPIKLNNQRTPGKNTKKFDDGTPLITYFLNKLLKVKNLDDIYVFCSDESIKKYISSKVKFLKRPTSLDTQETAPHEIISEFMKIIDADIYVACHCTSPFVTEEHIEECINAVKSGEYDSSFTAEKIQRLLWKENGQPLNFQADNVPRTQDISPIYNEISAAYVFKKELFLKTKRRIGFDPHLTIVNGVECVDIDYPEDFEIANAIYMSMIREK